MATPEQLDKYEMTIGIECHVQLATTTKLFSGADNDARDKEPNSAVNPIDFGLPGVLPVLNRRAIQLAVRAGKALNAKIAEVSRFDRKHYFYPDLPKGYQISQMYQPIILGGFVDAPLESGDSVRVRIHHAHLEEDAGKLTHHGTYSLVDLNRAGTPLIEIVSEPDIHSPAEAKAYATELHKLMTYAKVTLGDLYHGNMRFDVNISIAIKGSSKLGTRAEIKNLNSFRSVERAAQYEFERQVDVLEKGEKVVQETRGWDDATGKTSSQRSKEDAQDYRYMPDPDIPPVVLTPEDVNEMQNDFPTMPGEYRERWKDLGLDNSVVNAVLANQPVASLIDEIIELHGPGDIARPVFHWFASIQSEDLNMEAIESGQVNSSRLSELSTMLSEGKLSSTGAKEVFLDLFSQEWFDKTPAQIAEAKNLIQVSDESAINDVVDEVLADPSSAKSIEDIKAGQDKAIGFLVGQVMKKSQGRANPALVQKTIRNKLGV